MTTSALWLRLLTRSRIIVVLALHREGFTPLVGNLKRTQLICHPSDRSYLASFWERIMPTGHSRIIRKRTSEWTKLNGGGWMSTLHVWSIQSARPAWRIIIHLGSVHGHVIILERQAPLHSVWWYKLCQHFLPHLHVAARLISVGCFFPKLFPNPMFLEVLAAKQKGDGRGRFT